MADTVTMRFPFTGRWMAQNSPASRVPSHGTHRFGTTYAIDFVAVDRHGRSAARSWRAALSTEPPELFRGFGAPILAPVGGTVASVLDGEPDHEARRAQLRLIPYVLSQARRVRGGAAAIAGNHVVIALADGGPFVLLAHLKNGSVDAAVGQRVESGQRIGACGNSGNSTEPHVHVQVTDSLDWPVAHGLPILFSGAGGSDEEWMPRNSQVFEVS